MAHEYQARHALSTAGDVSSLARLQVDRVRAGLAVQVLAEVTDDGLEAARLLYAALHRACALYPPAQQSIPAAMLIRRHGPVSRWVA